ncbi:MAG: glutamate--cysteine ligase [Planctomycetia bacterium]|nr:glutamate--cysteine ligase [Planctomycetia bacterium]
MSGPARLSLFGGFGVELEYMIVDAETLSVRPIADELLSVGAGEPGAGDVERGEIGWSNELVAHVVELKVSEPAPSLEPLPALFQKNVHEINAILSARGARLMPAGMHPWMVPERETRIWPGEYGHVYQAFDRIFGCRGHGWANLQSLHLNLPFADDAEFARLHAAIRLVLPILPALTASSPVVEGRVTGLMDNRLEVYRTNSRKIARVAGQVIPEPAFSRAEYDLQILEPLYAEIAPHDPAGVLRHEWLNARGAIARFTRNAIEIRVMDVQECPLVDVAICAAAVAVLRALVDERWSSLAEQQSAAVAPLAEILLATIRDAEQAVIRNRDFLRLFGFPQESGTANDVWRHLLSAVPEVTSTESAWHEPLDVILNDGPLARRIVRALSHDDQSAVYRELCRCLEVGQAFQPDSAA